MVINKSILLLIILLFAGFVVRILSLKRKKKKFELNDFFSVLFNVTLFASGLIALFAALFNEMPFSEEFIISIPLIEFIAALTLMALAIYQLWRIKK